MKLFSIGADRWPGVSKLMEEAAETIQVLAKLMQTKDGDGLHWDGDLHPRIVEELGDLLAAIDFLISHNHQKVDRLLVEKRRTEKLALFRRWHLGDHEP